MPNEFLSKKPLPNNDNLQHSRNLPSHKVKSLICFYKAILCLAGNWYQNSTIWFMHDIAIYPEQQFLKIKT